MNLKFDFQRIFDTCMSTQLEKIVRIHAKVYINDRILGTCMSTQLEKIVRIHAKVYINDRILGTSILVLD